MHMSKQKNELVPELRFPEFTRSPGWDAVYGNKAFEQVSNKDHNSDLPILAITQEYGAIPREKIDYNVSVTEKSVQSYKVVDVGDFIISLRSFQGGIEYSEYKGLCSPAYVILRNKKGIDKRFFKQYFKAKSFIRDLTKNLEGLRDGKMISYNQFSEVLLPKPSPEEQKKIANCLASIDELITLHTQKLDAFKDYNKGLMQQLFPVDDQFLPKQRFPEFRGDGKWKPRVLGDFLRERSQIPVEKVPLYSLTIEDGVSPKTERYERSFLVKNESEAYKLVKPFDFAYNPMNLRFGAIAMHSGSEDVAVSKYYNIFHCDDTVDAKFCEMYFKSTGMITHYNNVATGSLLEKRRVHFSNFLRIEIPFPSLDEQRKIAQVIGELTVMVDKQSQKVDFLKEHKNGLMQKLFPAMDGADL